MSIADGIRKHGFRKWYERELLQSHAHLLLCFLCVIGLFGAFEAVTTFRAWPNQLLNLAAAGLCATTGLWALRRYLGLLATAEAAANQAECAQCGTYGRMDLVASDATGHEVQVRCRKCGHQWHISS